MSAMTTKPASTSVGAVAHPRALLADDEPFWRVVLERLLESAGVTVVAKAANGTEAVELWRARRPDVVLLDVCMPKLDGLQAARLILDEAPACVVLVSSEDRLDLLAGQVGAMGYVGKTSAAPDQLRQVISRALDRFREEVAPAAEPPASAAERMVGDGRSAGRALARQRRHCRGGTALLGMPRRGRRREKRARRVPIAHV